MMKYSSRTFLLLVMCGYPLFTMASGAYTVTETEPVAHHPNPLTILSGREGGAKSTPSKPPRISRIEQVLKSSPALTKTTPKAAHTAITKRATAQKYRIDRSRRKILYLTFDDGPLNGTENVIRVLREEGVEATMFFIGKHINKRHILYRQALSMPNLLIANHTDTHANGRYARFYSDVTRVVNDIERTQAIIGGAKYLRLAGRNVWRMPHVNRDDYALSEHRRSVEHAKYEALVSRGYQIFGWDIEWNFDPATGRPAYGADYMAERIERLYNSKRMAKSGKVIMLAHDYMFRGQRGRYRLRTLLQILQSNGWEFDTIDGYSSSTPDIYMGKSHKRSSDPLKGFETEWSTAKPVMHTIDSFVAKGLKKYLETRHTETKTISQDTNTAPIILTQKEKLATDTISTTVVPQ